MTTTELHNELLHVVFETGARKLRQDFEIEDLFEPNFCNYCSQINPNEFITWKFCPLCGRKLKKKEHNNDK